MLLAAALFLLAALSSSTRINNLESSTTSAGERGLKEPWADMKQANTTASQPPFIVTVNLSLDGDIKVILVVLAIFSLVAMVALVAIALAVMALVRILKSDS